jgi:hypothetical protein
VGNAFHLAMITWVVRLPATSTAPKKREIWWREKEGMYVLWWYDYWII